MEKNEEKLILAEKVFEVLPEKARYLYKTLSNEIAWTTAKPHFFKIWILDENSDSGILGKISIKEFKDLSCVNCLYEKGVGLTNKDNEAEIEYLYEKINVLENKVSKLKQENDNLQLQLQLHKWGNPYKDDMYPYQPYITYCNNEEK